MRLFAKAPLALLSLQAWSVAGTPITAPNRLQQRQDGSFAITGNANTAPRLEIREMQRDNQLWSLFVTGLQRLQFTDQRDELSYYQIAGIHGQPPRDWDGVGPTGNNRAGFCAHNSNIFGPWHRPYLVLLEMMIQNKARELVEEMQDGPEKDEWRASCDRLRLPYWDWAMNPLNGSPILPESLTTGSITVTFPGAGEQTIGNPLFQYAFRPLEPNIFSAPFTNWSRTVRGASSLDNTNAPSNNQLVEGNFQGGHTNTRSTLYNILSQYQTFNQFSNSGSERSQIGNLEAIHNGIHASFGNSHMWYPVVSAFDPVFFLHHANVDRITAIFQKLYPDTYVTPFAQIESTYFYNSGTVLNSNSELRPFHSNANGAFWTSESAKDITTFGYTYPELANNPSNDTLKASINALYAPASPNFAKRDDGPARTYLAVVDAPWAAMDTSYAIRLFLGQPSKPVLRWMQDKNYVGSVAILAQPGLQNKAVLTGTVSLTEKINERRKAGSLLDLVLDNVLSFLKSELVVKIEKNGKEVPRSKVPGLKIKIVSAEVRGRTSETEFPEWLNDLEDKLEIEDCKCDDFVEGFEPPPIDNNV